MSDIIIYSAAIVGIISGFVLISAASSLLFALADERKARARQIKLDTLS